MDGVRPTEPTGRPRPAGLAGDTAVIDFTNVKDSLTSMPTSIDVLYELAEPRAGYFTTAQAKDVGVSRQQLSYLARSGSIERVAHGVYRLRRFPAQQFEDVIVACLWAGEDVAASHETALAVYGLTDAMPAHVHLTVPRSFRGRRRGVVVHIAPLAEGQRTSRNGVPVTTVERTVADVAKQSGTAAATEAATQAIERGLVTRGRLRTALAGRGEDAEAVLAAIEQATT